MANDLEIVTRVVQGDRNAYAELVRRYETRIRGYCRLALGHAVLAEDAAQEVFIKAYQSLARFRGESSFSTWIYRIAVNHCTDLLRRIRRNRTESWEGLLEQEGDRIEALLASPEKLPPEDAAALIQKLLESLPEKSRQMVILREIHGLSYDELARSFHCTLDAVKSRLKRARQDLELRARHLEPAGNVSIKRG